MNDGTPNLADEIIKWVEQNRGPINRVAYGYVFVKIHQAHAASLGLYQESHPTTQGSKILAGEIHRPEV